MERLQAISLTGEEAGTGDSGLPQSLLLWIQNRLFRSIIKHFDIHVLKFDFVVMGEEVFKGFNLGKFIKEFMLQEIDSVVVQRIDSNPVRSLLQYLEKRW